MKTGTFKCLLLVATLLFLAFGLRAQSYTIDWYKIAGGGGTSAGGTYSVSGTIGQHDASGTISGGNYSLTGGFWSLIALVQTSGAPALAITFTGPNIVGISWPSPSTGFVLQQNSNLATTNWTTFGGAINDNGTIKSVTIIPPTGNLFYRLKQ
jgi:hypothetical protein